jgi:hypothetical protein
MSEVRVLYREARSRQTQLIGRTEPLHHLIAVARQYSLNLDDEETELGTTRHPQPFDVAEPWMSLAQRLSGVDSQVCPTNIQNIG